LSQLPPCPKNNRSNSVQPVPIAIDRSLKCDSDPVFRSPDHAALPAEMIFFDDKFKRVWNPDGTLNVQARAAFGQISNHAADAAIALHRDRSSLEDALARTLALFNHGKPK
jgi:hypothetical protein